jgi:hypothetical protein
LLTPSSGLEHLPLLPGDLTLAVTALVILATAVIADVTVLPQDEVVALRLLDVENTLLAKMIAVSATMIVEIDREALTTVIVTGR